MKARILDDVYYVPLNALQQSCESLYDKHTTDKCRWSTTHNIYRYDDDVYANRVGVPYGHTLFSRLLPGRRESYEDQLLLRIDVVRRDDRLLKIW